MKFIMTALFVVLITLTFLVERTLTQYKVFLISHCPIEIIQSLTNDHLFKPLSFLERQSVLTIIFTCLIVIF